MGCGASNESAAAGPRRGSPMSSRSNSVVSNSFTTTYASGSLSGSKKKYYVPAYKPGSSEADTDAEFQKWKTKSKTSPGNGQSGSPTNNEDPFGFLKSEKIVDEFVFGDFKVDPGDVQQQRIERFNRVRGAGDENRQALTRRGSGRNMLSALSRRKSVGTFVMNDFQVKTVDEGDDPMYHFLHEVKVPPGFRPLQRYSLFPMRSHAARVKVVAISPSEEEFVSCSTEDLAVGIYSMTTGEAVTAYAGHTSPVVSAVYSRDGKYLATSARDNTIIVWDTMQKENGKRVVRTLELPCLAISIDFSCDAKRIVCGCQDKQCRVWDVSSNKVEGVFSEHEGVVVCIACQPGGTNFALSGGGDRVLRLWDIGTATAVRQFIGHDGIVISVSFTPDGERILSNDDRACKMWMTETGACILNVTLQSLTSAAALTEFPPPMPLPPSFTNRVPLTSTQLGFAPNGIFGQQATNACKIGSSRSVFTLSCLLPGQLSRSYFAVACTNRMVYVCSCATGKEEISIHARAAVFALSAGREETLLFGDVYGNVTLVKLAARSSS